MHEQTTWHDGQGTVPSYSLFPFSVSSSAIVFTSSGSVEPTILWVLSSMYAIFRHLGLKVGGRRGEGGRDGWRERKIGRGKGREREGEGGRREDDRNF